MILLAFCLFWLAAGCVTLLVDARQTGRTVRQALADAFDVFTR